MDVFVPSYNESAELLEVTLLACQSMEYPEGKLRVFLLDDGGTDQKCTTGSKESQEAAQKRRAELTAMCEELGVIYMTREKNEHAKAGNLNSAFQQLDGDLVMVVDADHVPTGDFLQNTVGYFGEDEKLFLVQTPHFFRNPDPIEKNLDTFHQMPSENEMFYRVIQRGLDYWNAAFFCGSGALLRRAHLETVGGFSGETITEDCETALTLHTKGYNSLYVATPMLSGLAPETMGGFISQRIRWAQGMTQIMRLKFPLFAKGLTIPQRICYMNTCMFWLFPFCAHHLSPRAPMAFLLLRAENLRGELGDVPRVRRAVSHRGVHGHELPLRQGAVGVHLGSLRTHPVDLHAAGDPAGDHPAEECDLQGHAQGRALEERLHLAAGHAVLPAGGADDRADRRGDLSADQFPGGRVSGGDHTLLEPGEFCPAARGAGSDALSGGS